MKRMEDRVFREFLQKKGLKFTKERAAILKGVFSARGHFDPDDLLIKMRGKGIRVSKASIYRTLPLLLESGLIEQVLKVDKHAHYEHTFGRGHHDHLICLKCGKVIPLYSRKLEKLQENLCRKEKFKCLTHTLEIRGYCLRCNSKSGLS
ncbi:MAG: transcriptional repressor [Nitrospirae bacterium]|nr:MAG: transcriptional repressor [Nitrospirota bacterium]